MSACSCLSCSTIHLHTACPFPPPGSVASISDGLLASGPDAAALNDNQVFLMHVSPELRRRYESTLLSQVEQVGGARWCCGSYLFLQLPMFQAAQSVQQAVCYWLACAPAQQTRGRMFRQGTLLSPAI